MREEAWLKVIEEAVTPLHYGASHKFLDGSLCGLERKKPTEGLRRRDMDGGLDDGKVIALEIKRKGSKHFADASPYGRLIAHEDGAVGAKREGDGLQLLGREAERAQLIDGS